MSAPATACRGLLLVAWVVAVGLAGCGSQDANVPTQSTGPPSATPDVTASADTPVPVTTVGPRATVDTDVPEEDSLPVSATAERDGIRLTLRLRWNPVYAGNRMTFTVTVENLGDETLRWFVDSCEITHRYVDRSTGNGAIAILLSPTGSVRTVTGFAKRHR